MSVYQTGAVKVVVGYPVVVGYGTEFDTNVGEGYLFRVTGDAAFYNIAEVVSATKLNLSAPYAHPAYEASTVLTSVPYQVVTDYTPNYSFPELGPNDGNFVNVFTNAIRKVDSVIYELGDYALLVFEARSAPGTPEDDSTAFYLTASGTSPNRQVIQKMMNESGEEIIISSLIV